MFLEARSALGRTELASECFMKSPQLKSRIARSAGASCYHHQAAGGDRLPLLPNRRRGLGRGGPFYWIPLSPSLSPLVLRAAGQGLQRCRDAGAGQLQAREDALTV